MTRTPGLILGALLLGLLTLPLVALATSVSPANLLTGFQDPRFLPALGLSLTTTLTSLLLTLVMGTPLAWWIARTDSRAARAATILVELPIVVPPAVVGVALLQTFGRQGWLGPALATLDVSLPFTTAAVVLAQVMVASPFYVQAATSAFREVDEDTMLVARTLGATPRQAWWRVALPMAAPGLLAGASLAWARALGEFGATLLFAGNMPGRTQTMPLAIFSALESDLTLATVFSLVLAALGVLLLAALRLGSHALLGGRT